MKLLLLDGLPELLGDVVIVSGIKPRLDTGRHLCCPLSQFVTFERAAVLEVYWVQLRISRIWLMFTTRNDTSTSRKLNLGILEDV